MHITCSLFNDFNLKLTAIQPALAGEQGYHCVVCTKVCAIQKEIVESFIEIFANCFFFRLRIQHVNNRPNIWHWIVN